jgi:hypothetical protein
MMRTVTYAAGVALGVFTGDEEWASVKGIFWSANPLGDGLHDALRALVRAGVLEHRDEPDDQYRWRTEGAHHV